MSPPGSKEGDPKEAARRIIRGGGQRVSLGGAMVSADDLSDAQRRACGRAVELSRSEGILVGAFAGMAAWDVRPILLQEGKLSLVRFTDPGLALDRSRFSLAKNLFEQVARSHLRTGPLAVGESAGQIWVRRPYFQKLASDEVAERSDPAERAQLAARITETVLLQLERGLVHGHVALSNLADNDGEILMFDHGFAVSAAVPAALPGIAPETAKGAPPHSAGDIYGLAFVLREVLAGGLRFDQAQLIERMMSGAPETRPHPAEVRAAFLAGAPVAQPGQPGGRTFTPRNQPIRSGRLIDPTRAERTPGPSAPYKAPGVDTPAPVVPPPSSAIPAAQQRRSESRVLGPVILGVLLLVAALLAWRHFGGFSGQSTAIPVTAYWASGRPDLMSEVALLALDGDLSARETIVNDALRGTDRAPIVRSRLIRIAFSPPLRDRLKQSEMDAALRLGLINLVPHEAGRVPALSSLPPELLVAVVGDLPLDAPLPALERIELSALSGLPAPYGAAFAALAESGARYLAEDESRALAHILAGEASADTAARFLPADLPAREAEARVRVLSAIAENDPRLAAPIMTALSAAPGGAGSTLGWFQAEDAAAWSETPPAAKLSLLGGALPEQPLTSEQLADLLSFPARLVRAEAAAALQERIPKLGNSGELLILLAGDRNTLSRLQTSTLVTALGLEGEQQYAFLARWFETKPDPSMVVQLLIALRSVKGLDPFSVDAARYLSARDWDAGLPELEMLASHGEPLVRALAYVRLDPRLPEAREILSRRVREEKDRRLHSELARRLTDAREAPSEEEAESEDDELNEPFGE